MANELVNVRTVCELAGVEAATVRRWIKEGRFPGARKVGPQQWRIPRVDVDAVLMGEA